MDKKGSGNWLRKRAHKPETEALIFTAQEQALRTNEICQVLHLQNIRLAIV